jgi:hypothetical protein
LKAGYLNFIKFVCVGSFITTEKNVNLRRDENYTIIIYVIKTKKKIFRTICWKLLDEAKSRPATAMSPKYYFRLY